MKIMILGARGMLGSALVDLFVDVDCQLYLYDKMNLDICVGKDVNRMVSKLAPDVIINAAAMTAVDDCELNPQLAYTVNAESVHHIVDAAKEVGSKIVHYSTDFVFDGTSGTPYKEFDITNPINVYGKTKLDGDEILIQNYKDNFLIIRTQAMFGEGGNNFPKIMAKMILDNKPLSVVVDQIGKPTYARDLAKATQILLDKDVRGIINVANSGKASKYEVARAVSIMVGMGTSRVKKCTTEEYLKHHILPAKRPLNSVLDTNQYDTITGKPLPPWVSSLQKYLIREVLNVRPKF
jgi:dTDP-4-dehydrorhamnose reductase